MSGLQPSIKLQVRPSVESGLQGVLARKENFSPPRGEERRTSNQ
jgi:hypothetical protein